MKRVIIYPEYQKPLDGYSVAENIGIDLMLNECRHFRKWIEKLMA